MEFVLADFPFRDLLGLVIRFLFGFILRFFVSIIVRSPRIPVLQASGHPGLEKSQRPVNQLIDDTSKLQGMQNVFNIVTPYARHILDKKTF